MKPIASLLFILSLFSFAQIPEKTGAQICSEGKMKKGRLSLLKSESANSPKHSFDVLHYALSLDLMKNYASPFPHSFFGKVVVTVRAETSIAALSFDANNTSLTVDSVQGAGHLFTQSGNILAIVLDASHPSNDTFQVTIHYHHNNVADDAFYVGTDGMVFTDAEPEGARKWFPCWDKPSDKATVELTAKVPTTVKLGSNGLLQSAVTSGDTMIYHWMSKEPVSTYLVVLSSKVNYNLDIVYWHKLSNAKDSIPIYFYWNTGESQTGLNNIKAKIIPMTDRYSQIYGEHAFQKNGFATMNSLFTWGGMENQTLTSLQANGYGSENLVSHEYAHQWTGDMITCATWADIWLNEGFATYSEALWYEYTGGYSRYKQDINGDATQYLGANPGRPIYMPSWIKTTPGTNDLFSTAMTYNKGACVLHMLRYTLGDSLFFKVLYEYGNDPALRYNSITTDDFIAHVSASAGQDLTWFFDQWVKTANHPLYNIYYYLDPDYSRAGVTITQTQAGTYWKMPVTLKFTLASGADTTIRVFNADNKDTFQFKFPSAPVSMVFDPNNDIVLKTVTITKLTGVLSPETTPTEYALAQNFPNPFNPSTTIEFTLPSAERVDLSVYDITGREIATLLNQILPAGVHRYRWNAAGRSSGVYYYRLSTPHATQTKAMVLLQ